MKRFLLVIILIVMLLSFSTNSSSSENDIKTKLLVKTIYFKNDDSGYIRFYTNDTKYCSSNGGIGYFNMFKGIGKTFKYIEAEVIKDSGSHYMYGIVFCYEDNEHYYRLLINTKGVYEIFKKVSNENSWYNFKTKAWQRSNSFSYPSSGYLNKGYGAKNIIKVINSGGGNFDIYFNDKKADFFRDKSYSFGKNGFNVYVGTQNVEEFPNVPVDVRCKLLGAE